jgi:formylglycine-generating enzyme required for sulfatase activity
MAGNVWEWVSSLYKPYPYTATDGREDLTSSKWRVFRGGAWYNVPWTLRSASRVWFEPAFRADNIGFRCAQGVR